MANIGTPVLDELQSELVQVREMLRCFCDGRGLVAEPLEGFTNCTVTILLGSYRVRIIKSETTYPSIVPSCCKVDVQSSDVTQVEWAAWFRWEPSLH